MDEINLSKKEMLEAISRSGYLLESEVASVFAKLGYFTETNHIIIDATTGKSREIDLLAEYYESRRKKHNDMHATSSIKYAIEVKNNTYPLVLLTKYENSPYTEPYTFFKEAHTNPVGIQEPSGQYISFYDELFEGTNHNFFTQYCSFQRKKKGNKNELMASHPEMLHSALLKICQHCEEEAEFWENFETDKFYRKFLYLPLLILNDSLYELTEPQNNKLELRSTEVSRLFFNYHYKDTPRTSIVYVVTRKALLGFLDDMLELERNIENRMYLTLKENEI